MDIKKLRPLNGNTLVKDIKQEEKTVGGIYIPDAAKEDIKVGEVISTSNYTTDDNIIIESKVKEGDNVLYRNVAGGGSCFQESGDMYRVLVPVEILAVVE